ncbi:MAG: dihydrodipicolinate synthase family protein [Fuerstiella sp.]
MTRFSGIIPPVVTPLLTHDQLDPESVDRVVNHLVDGGVNGLFVLGTTGEGPSLTYQIRYEMVERSCEAAAGRVPVLVCVTDTSLAEAIHLAEHAATSGAAAVVAAAPFYFGIGQDALEDWFVRLADASPLPVLLYNMPSCVKVCLESETVARLAKHQNIAGIKDSSGDLAYFQRLCQQHQADPDFVVFMGPEELIPQAVEAGADGGVCGGGNLLPHLYVELFQAARAGDAVTVSRLRELVSEVFAHLYHAPDGTMNLIPALKLAMSQCGLCGDTVAPPLLAPAADHAAQVRQALPRILEQAGSGLTAVATDAL